jgi:hypothetical protein
MSYFRPLGDVLRKQKVADQARLEQKNAIQRSERTPPRRAL